MQRPAPAPAECRAATPDPGAPPPLPIAAVERACGVAKETLRVWERRYGFPRPVRDAAGDRLYPADQVEQLQLVKRAVALGHRPGQLLRLPPSEWLRLAATEAAATRPRRDGRAALPAAAPVPAPEQAWLPLLRRFDPEALRQALRDDLARRGLRGYVLDTVVPTLRALGDAWHRGSVEIFEEHLFTHAATAVLREAVAQAAAGPGGAPGDGPRVLLTTLPGELHAFGLLLAEALLVPEGARCHPLGAPTPVAQVVAAVAALRSDIVVLSCSPCVDARQLREDVAGLRARLPDAVEIWIGGSAPVLRRHPVAGTRLLDSLDALAPALQRWRQPGGRGGRGRAGAAPAGATGAP